jgi:hypothetical protein|tara:strand:+ start:66 stop:278 length:213 start_codon:yes stop_codon:yes gene_type:complete
MPIEFDYRRLVHAGHVPVNAEGTGYVKPASGRMTVNTLGPADVTDGDGPEYVVVLSVKDGWQRVPRGPHA